MPRGKKKSQKNNIFVPAIKSSVFAVVISIIAVMVLAMIVKSAMPPDGTITMANQLIKMSAIFIAAFFAAKNSDKPIQSGIAGALIYLIISFIVFSLLWGGMGDIVLLLADAAMGAVMGVICGLIITKVMRVKNA